MARTQKLHMYLSAEESARVKKMAKYWDVTESDVIRWLIEREFIRLRPYLTKGPAPSPER